MASDCLAVMDTLGWSTAHVVGHSMGGMIAVKLAAMHPTRIASLTVISTSAGGWDALKPRSWRQIKMAWKVRCTTMWQRCACVVVLLMWQRCT